MYNASDFSLQSNRWWEMCDLWFLCSAMHFGPHLWWMQLRILSGTLRDLWWTRCLWCLLLQRMHHHREGCKSLSASFLFLFCLIINLMHPGIIFLPLADSSKWFFHIFHLLRGMDALKLSTWEVPRQICSMSARNMALRNGSILTSFLRWTWVFS